MAGELKEYRDPGTPFHDHDSVLGEEFGFHVQFAEPETCLYEVHRPFVYKMKTNMENLESEENGGMWREKPSGLLALVGHRPPCSPVGTKTTCAHNFEANSSVKALYFQATVNFTRGQCTLPASYMKMHARHT